MAAARGGLCASCRGVMQNVNTARNLQLVSTGWAGSSGQREVAAGRRPGESWAPRWVSSLLFHKRIVEPTSLGRSPLKDPPPW
jgi:hypothetical protein